MKQFKIHITLPLILTGLFTLNSFSQETSILSNDRQEIRYLDKNIIEITDSLSGRKRLYNISDNHRIKKGNAPDSLVIHLSQIDTALYEGRFKKIAEVPLHNRYDALWVYDTDHDGKIEIIGIHRNPNWPLMKYERRIYERENDSTYIHVHTINVIGGIIRFVGDIDKDGLSDIFIQYGSNLFIYESSDNLTHPIDSVYTYNMGRTSASASPILVNDLDLDGRNEIIHLGDVESPDSSGEKVGSFVAENIGNDTSYNRVFFTEYPKAPSGYPNVALAGFTYGDYDMDGFLEYVVGDLWGRVYVVENRGNDHYELLNWEGYIESMHAFWLASGDDINGNGKPEFFVSGDHSEYHQGHKVIMCFEASGDNTYEPVFKFDLTEGNTLFANSLSTGDVDGDGVQELVLYAGPYFLVFKSTTNGSYELFWAKKTHFPTDIKLFDLNNDGIDEILLGSWPVDSTGNYFWTHTDIFTFNTDINNIKELETRSPSKFILYQNYPNPFNATTNIRYEIFKKTNVKLIILDMLGKEVVTLLQNKEHFPGEYKIKWDGKNKVGKEVSSGVYFVSLQTDKHQKVKKIVLLR